MEEKEEKSQKKKGPEKPLSLWGASFREVMGALLNTPKPEKEDKEKLDGTRPKSSTK